MIDIRKFLKSKAAKEEYDLRDAVDQSNDDGTNNVENDSDWTDESDESTLHGEEDFSSQSIGRNWQDKLALLEYENKENAGPSKVLEFSPPEKLPSDPPSHLIWEIFGREREMRRKQMEQEQMDKKVQINKKPESSQSVRRNPVQKKVPLNVRFDNTLKVEMPAKGSGLNHVAASILKENEENQDLTFQSTLLHMRVVGRDLFQHLLGIHTFSSSELEQEIDNFKKENKKIISIKKKLQLDKDKLAKELADFENLKDTERKKMEEERRRNKRDKLLLEKDKKEQLKGNQTFNVNIL